MAQGDLQLIILLPQPPQLAKMTDVYHYDKEFSVSNNKIVAFDKL